jgi:MHS family proline/betaine transporter-like MFS transporter
MSQFSSRLSSPAIATIVCGNILEWYDFAVYGYFVATIGRQFFPTEDRIAEVLAAFGVFAVGFIGRIGGAFLYGLISDRVGRGSALQLSVALMAVATTMIGVLPGHATLGSVAPALLILFRLLQGLSVGGEFTTSMTLLAERAVGNRRGLACGMVGAAAIGGFVIGSGVAWLLSWSLAPTDLQSWGWRIPFLLGSGLGIFVWIIRRQFLADQETSSTTFGSNTALIAVVLSKHYWGLIRTVAGISLYMVGFYVPFVYLATGLQEKGALTMKDALAITTASLIGLTILTPVAGWIPDRIGDRQLLITCSLLLALGTPILLLWIEHGGSWRFAVGMSAMVVLYAPLNAVAALPCALQFPRELRSTAFSVGFNVAAMLFGGLSPLAANLLMIRTGCLGAVGILTVFTAAILAWAWIKCPEAQDLNEPRLSTAVSQAFGS